MKLIPFLFFIFLVFGNMTQASSASRKVLPPCLNSPNCVSSQAEDAKHYIAPFNIIGDPDRAWTALKRAIDDKSRMVITHETHDSLHAEAISLVFRFVDDINVILDVDALLIHIRSASRTGHSDFGVNRKRIEGLRTKLQKAGVIK